MLKNTIYLLLIFFSFLLQEKEFSTDELIGKGEIDLFGESHKLQKEVSDAFLLMKSSALKDGIDIQVVSSYRGFEHQNRIWNNKYEKYISKGLSPKHAINKIIEYSTIPGTSRHHWGTEVDIIDSNAKILKNVLDPNKFGEGKGFYKLKKWLDINAEKYGFYIVYTDDYNRKGFKYEPWHYSYKPISKPMLKEYLKLDIQELLKTEKIAGSECITDQFIEKYINENILDINPELK